MTTPRFIVTDAPSADEIKRIDDGLAEFNAQQAGRTDHRPLAVLVKDPQTGQVIGGLSGRTSLGLMFVDLFYLPPRLRGVGVGREILQAAEAEARKRGCRAAVLYTISFQAPDFYRKQGWQSFGEVACDPPGTCRVFMTKTLA